MARFNFISQIKEQIESRIHGFSGGRSTQASSESTPQQIFTDEITVEMKEASRLATDFETHMGKTVAVKAWLPGVCFAMCMSLACIMEGYGLVLIAGFFASSRFKTDFGCPVTPGQDFDCEIPTVWQTGLVDGALGGQIIGIVLNGWLTEKYGYRRTFLGATIAITGFFSITFFASSLWVLLIGFILCGIPWGIFQTLTTSYASDVCPTPIRAYFTMWTNLCWVLGQLIGASVQRGLVSTTSEWNYKIPFLLQWAFPLPIIIAAFAAPESPWWLMRQGRHKDVYTAMKKLQRKRASPPGYSLDNHVTMLFVTNKEEEADIVNGGKKMGYRDCFKGVNCRRTINTCAVWSIQNACGAALMQFSTYFFLQAGLPSKWAFTCTMVQYGNGIIGTVVSWALVTGVGRRSLFLSGLVMLLALLIAIGTVSTLSISSGKSGITVGTLLMVFTLAYNCTIGPVTYSLVSELPSTRLKSKTINMARACYLLVGLLNGAITPIMLNPESLNWGGKTSWFWAGVTLVCTIYTFFEVPEPKDLTYGQIDHLYARKVSARHFKAEGEELRFSTSRSGSPNSGGRPLSTAIEFSELSRAIVAANAVATAAVGAATEVVVGNMPVSPSSMPRTTISPLDLSQGSEFPLPTTLSAIGTHSKSEPNTPSTEATLNISAGEAQFSALGQEDSIEPRALISGEAEARV